MYPFLFLMTEKSGIINMQIWRIFKKLFQCLIDRKYWTIKFINEYTTILTGNLINIFKCFICIKLKSLTINIQNGWIHSSIVLWKKKYMARFCNNPPDYNIDLSNECTKPIIQAKDRHIA